MTDVSSLFVDKFTLVYRCSEEDGEGIAATIRSYQDEPELSLRYLGSNYQNRRYRKNWELPWVFGVFFSNFQWYKYFRNRTLKTLAII
jgi:hypothetical protein